MKKTNIKKWLILTMVILLGVSQTNFSVFAETIIEQTQITNESSAEQSSTTQSETLESTPAKSQNAPKWTSTLVKHNDTISSASFENQSLTDQNSISYTWEQLMGTERFNKKLSINVKYDSQPNSGKKIIIKLSEEFQYSSLPGFKSSNGRLVFDASSLPSQLSSVILNATIDYPKVYGQTLTASGTVTYELANVTPEVNMDIMLGVNNRFIVNEQGRAYSNPIEVICTEDGNENFYHEIFENITLATDKMIIPRFYTNPTQKYNQIYQNQTGSFYTGKSMFITTGSQSIEAAGGFFDTVSYEVRYNKALNLKGVVFENAVTTSVQELPEKEDSKYKYAVISANQAMAKGSVYYEVSFADETSIEPNTTLLIESTGKISYKAYNREEVIDAALYDQGIVVGVKVIQDFVNELTSADLTRSVSMNNESLYSYLGSFRVDNEQPEIVTNQKFLAEFDTGNLNVQAMRIATVGGKTANIKMTTTTGRVIEFPDNNSTSSTQ